MKYQFLAVATFLLCLLCLKGWCVELTKPMKDLLEKNKSFGFTKFPISYWSCGNMTEHGKYVNEAEVKFWADAGFTVPQTFAFDPKNKKQMKQIRQILKWANKYGMKMIVMDPRAHARKIDMKEYEAGIKAAAADFKGYPAVFGFHVGDEPGAEMKDVFFECYRTQKAAAPHLHPYMNLLPHLEGIEERAGTDTWPNYLDECVSKSNLDLLSYDCYMQLLGTEEGIHDYYRNLKYNREAALRNGIPFWNTVLDVGHLWYRCPTQDDIRWQFNTSIAAGANGISWFFYFMLAPNANYRMAPVDQLWNKTPTYYDLARIQVGFHNFYGDLFNKLVSTRVTFYGKVYGDGVEFTPDDLILKVESSRKSPMLIGEFIDAKGERYAMFVNNSQTNDDLFKITFPKGSKTYTYNWYNREYEGGAYCCIGGSDDESGNRIHSLMLAPGQEAVYRIVPAK